MPTVGPWPPIILGTNARNRTSSSRILHLTVIIPHTLSVKSGSPEGPGTGVCQGILPIAARGPTAKKLERLTLSSGSPSDLDVLSHNLRSAYKSANLKYC